MTSSICFIINPAAGFGKTKRKLKSLIKEIHAQDARAKIMLTGHPLHAIGLTKEALSEGADRIVVIGGDGTLNEVVNGYFDIDGNPLNKNASIAIIPSGTGSDFVRATKPLNGLEEAIARAIHGTPTPTDVGVVEAHDANGRLVQRYFINVSSMGLSGLVAGFMKTITRKLGPKSAYFLATMQAIRTLKPATIRITSDGKVQTLENCSLVSFANGRYFGSGMKIAPDADLNDGMLDVITIKDLGIMFFLLNGYHVYQGTHLGLENVQSHKESSCKVEALTKEPVYIETDGELFAQLPARYSVKPSAILMIR